ncbi:MAG TPA: acyl-CoA synthetase [Streptosporangiaceae bacterium]|jgi:long-chain acyl-CoA synthetase
MGSLGFWRIAERRPEWVAVVDAEDVEHTAGEVLARANRVAHGLRARGLAAGDAVAMVVPNSVDMVVINLAATQTGLYLTPINWHFTAPEIAYIVRDCEAKILFLDARFAAEGVRAADEAGLPADARISCGGAVPGFASLDDLADGQPATPPDDRVAGTTMHYTSGTTGKPKGVRRGLSPFPPDDSFELLTGLMQMFGATPEGENAHLVTAPNYHTAVTTFGMSALHLGHTLVLTDKWAPEDTLRRTERYRVTSTHMVPTHFVRMLRLPDDVRNRYDVSSMRWLIHAAAPCPVPVKRAMLDWWGPCVWEYYAATEGGGTIASPEDWLAHPGTVGKPWPIAEVRVVDDDGTDVADGTPGTIYMRMSSGDFEYKDDPAKTAGNRLGGFFTVGDIGYLTDGFLYLCDRKADMIISGGANIYPAEIENELMTHPKVADVAVFGVPDTEWGEQIKAIVEPVEGNAPGDDLAAEIIASLDGRLARMKWPKTVEFIAEMPRDPSGKLNKRRLRDPYWEGHDTAI